jgi:periplasmic protein CpxP/Spy
MSWFRIFMLLSILLSIATTSSPARSTGLVAQNNPAPTGNFQAPAGGAGSLVKELNLSPDQIQRLQQLRIGNKGRNKQRRERRQALQIAKQELAQLLQGNASSEQIRQKRQQVQSIQREVADINFESKLAIREILTPEQRIKYNQLMQQRHQNRGKLK